MRGGFQGWAIFNAACSNAPKQNAGGEALPGPPPQLCRHVAQMSGASTPRNALTRLQASSLATFSSGNGTIARRLQNCRRAIGAGASRSHGLRVGEIERSGRFLHGPLGSAPPFSSIGRRKAPLGSANASSKPTDVTTGDAWLASAESQSQIKSGLLVSGPSRVTPTRTTPATPGAG